MIHMMVNILQTTIAMGVFFDDLAMKIRGFSITLFYNPHQTMIEEHYLITLFNH